MSIKEKPSFKNFIANIPFVISGVVYAAFFTTSFPNQLAALLILALVVVAALYVDGLNWTAWRSHLSFENVIATLLAQVVSADLFYSYMYDWAWSLDGKVRISPSLILAMVALLGVIATFYFMSNVVIFISYDAKGDGCFKAIKEKFFSDSIINICVVTLRILILLCFAGVIICSFNASIWLDEAYTLGQISNSMTDIIKLSAADVHPPLYYMMLKIIEVAFSVFSTNFTFRVTISKLFSVTAYVLVALLCWKKLSYVKTRGFRELLILCLFATPSVLAYGTEIRMYSWALFFVVGTFLYANDIVRENSSARTWVALTIFSLCSAYTHNFALIAMAAVWLYLFIWILINKRGELKKLFGFGIVTAVCYLPWLVVLLRQMSRVFENYNYRIGDITVSTVRGYAILLFPSFMRYILVILVCFWYKNRKDKRTFEIFYGALVVLTTFAVGISVSLIISPIFAFRYIIPCVLCLWITVMMCWGRLSDGLKILIAFMIVCGCVSSEISFISSEFVSREQAAETVEFVDSLEEEDIVCVGCDRSDAYTAIVASVYMVDREVYFVTDESYVFGNYQRNVCPNLQAVDTSFITDSLDEGKTVYLITTSEEADALGLGNNNDSVIVGEYYFWGSFLVYRLTP